MTKQELLERIIHLEARLDAAEARITALEWKGAQPVLVPYKVTCNAEHAHDR